MGELDHVPVLLERVLEFAKQCDPHLIVDCTLGGCGHAMALLDAFPSAQLVGFDRDPHAIAVARRRLALYGDRVRLHHAELSTLTQHLVSSEQPDFLLADLGVSSYQLDTAERGFSFRLDGPLDMRMGEGISAAELIERTPERELADLIYQYGEERRSRAVARAIKQRRPTTTGELASIVRSVVPKSKDGIDPATRTFQALRIAVNDELGELKALLEAIPHVLRDGGLALIISFHSLEDRAVKRVFREASRYPAPGPGGLPPAEDREPTLEVLTPKPLVPTTAECAHNPRARSAKLRVARRRPRMRGTP